MNLGIPFVDKEEVQATHHVNFVAGAFHSGAWRIPFFSSTLSFKEAAEDLRLTSEMPGLQTATLTIDELFQRDVDWARVEGPLLKYLKSESEPQFFNALTIALMPYDESRGVLEGSFENGERWQAPGLVGQANYGKMLDVGPIRFGFYGNWTSPDDAEFVLGKLRWNKDQVYAVAIDGQHRLAAIKRFVEMKGISRSRVPVIFLVFDPRLGFSGPHVTDVTQIMRKIFIDLNKHARNVSRARQILLDDRDPFSVCARSLISQSLASSLDSLQATPPKLPLSIVDWHSEQAKFDSGPYLTTVLGLEWLMTVILGVKPVNDLEAYGKLEKQISKLAFRLNVDLNQAKERLAVCEGAWTPFSYSEADLEVISEGFQRTWNESIVHLFCEFSPYREFLHLRTSGHTVSTEWQWWYKLTEAATSGADAAERELNNYMLELHHAEHAVPYQSFASKLETLSQFKAGNLAFNVAFQRAYFLAFYLFLQFSNADMAQLESWEAEDLIDLDDVEEDFSLDEDEYGGDLTSPAGSSDSSKPNHQLTRSREFVKALNDVVAAVPGFLSVSVEVPLEERQVDLWLGSLRKPEGGIDFTQSASGRAADLLYLWATIATEFGRGSAASSFDDFWAEIVDGTDVEAFKKMSWAARRLWKDEKSVAGRILSARGEEFTEEAAIAEIEDRLRCIWELVN